MQRCRRHRFGTIRRDFNNVKTQQTRPPPTSGKRQEGFVNRSWEEKSHHGMMFLCNIVIHPPLCNVPVADTGSDESNVRNLSEPVARRAQQGRRTGLSAQTPEMNSHPAKPRHSQETKFVCDSFTAKVNSGRQNPREPTIYLNEAAEICMHEWRRERNPAEGLASLHEAPATHSTCRGTSSPKRQNTHVPSSPRE